MSLKGKFLTVFAGCAGLHVQPDSDVEQGKQAQVAIRFGQADLSVDADDKGHTHVINGAKRAVDTFTYLEVGQEGANKGMLVVTNAVDAVPEVKAEPNKGIVAAAEVPAHVEVVLVCPLPVLGAPYADTDQRPVQLAGETDVAAEARQRTEDTRVADEAKLVEAEQERKDAERD